MRRYHLSKVGSSKSALVGLFLCAIAVLFNKWLVEIIVAPDNKIESTATTVLIASFQISLLMFGGYLFVKVCAGSNPVALSIVALNRRSC